MAAIGERIRAARITAGLSQQALADQMGLSKMAISKYETGAVIPKSGMLIALGKVLDVKVEYFFRPAPVHIEPPLYRCKKPLAKKEEDMVLGRTLEWLERYLTIEQITGVKKDLDLLKEENCRVRTFNDIEKLAERVRKEWALGLDPIENVMDVLEQHGIKVGEVDAPENFDALTLRYDDNHPIIIVNKKLPGDRQRFSLAHELGHLLMKIVSNLDNEIAAHRFAGAFLVPREMAILELGASRKMLDFRELYVLKHKFGMSMAAWIHRASDLGIITKDASDRHWMQLRARGWHKREPEKQFPIESPTQMKLLLFRAVSERKITQSRFIELLGEENARVAEPCA